MLRHLFSPHQRCPFSASQVFLCVKWTKRSGVSPGSPKVLTSPSQGDVGGGSTQWACGQAELGLNVSSLHKLWPLFEPVRPSPPGQGGLQTGL